MLLIGIDNRDFQPAHNSDGINPSFAVVESIIHPFEGRAFEDPQGFGKSNAVDLEVTAVLFLVPNILNMVYLQNVNIQARSKARNMDGLRRTADSSLVLAASRLRTNSE